MVWFVAPLHIQLATFLRPVPVELQHALDPTPAYGNGMAPVPAVGDATALGAHSGVEGEEVLLQHRVLVVSAPGKAAT